MKKIRIVLLTALLAVQFSISFGQDFNIEIPAFKDKYSGYVQQLENGSTEIDYTDFRHSFLESKQYSKKEWTTTA